MSTDAFGIIAVIEAQFAPRVSQLQAVPSPAGAVVTFFYAPSAKAPELLDQITRTHGWAVSISVRNVGRFEVTLEPMVQHRRPLNGIIFHATKIACLAAIRERGIIPQARSNTWTQRLYPTARSFHALTLWDAFTYITSHNDKAPAERGPRPLTRDILEEWEILSFDAGPFSFFDDVLMAGALWTPDIIPPEALSRVEDWRTEYDRAASWQMPLGKPLQGIACGEDI
jgi:hypothetical protein